MSGMQLSMDEVTAKIKELSLKPELTENERTQFDNLIKAVKTVAEQQQAENDRVEKRHQREVDRSFKERELKQSRNHDYLIIGLEVGKIAIFAALFVVGLKFETGGAWTFKTANVLKSLSSLCKN